MIADEIEGIVQGHRDGHGFVLREDGESDIYLSSQEMRAVLHKDRVRVRVVRHDRRGRPEGRVVEILERPQHPIIGRLVQEHGVWLVAPEDKRYGQDILVSEAALASAQIGQIVVVHLSEPPALYGQPAGKVIEVLGEVDDPGMEIEIAVRKYGVPHIFSPACLSQAEALPDKVRAVDMRDRVDLTDVPLVTIDGEDARDFDDAVYCTPAKVGRGNGWRLLVAIADVSHYVRSGSAIDIDAYERATSVYFPRRVIPMLPEKLSNGLCSLNPEVERLSMVCDMLITGQGELHAYQFYPAVIRSHARFTYTEVAAILANPHGAEAQQRTALVPDLLHLNEVFRALLQSRKSRGAVDFDTVETQIISDDQGRIQQIVPRVRNDAHRLIEEAMLAANVCSAEFIERSRHPGLFRVHDKPSLEKIEILRGYLQAMGVGMGVSDQPHTREFQALAEATKEMPEAPQIHTMLLRSMQQAMYTPNNEGHFGLAFEAYTHFTSPIRRYPDLLVHRVIKAILAGDKYKLPALPTPGEAQERMAKRLASKAAARAENGQEATPRRRRSAGAQAELQGWEAAGLHCSANERRADEASRDVESWLKCKYMREHLGEEFNGKVSAVTSFGLFITLQDMYVEGLLHITELGGDYYRYDERRQELRGERTGVRYALGAPMRVQVSRVDLDGRRIDFRLVPDPLQEAVPAGQRKERGFGSAAGREKHRSDFGKDTGRSKAGGAKSSRVRQGGKSESPAQGASGRSSFREAPLEAKALSPSVSEDWAGKRQSTDETFKPVKAAKPSRSSKPAKSTGAASSGKVRRRKG